MEMPRLYTYRLELTRVYDGDTIHGTVDLGFNTFKVVKLRLEGINTPEIRTKDLVEKDKGLAAKAFVKEELARATAIYASTTRKGKFGRWIAKVFYEDEGVIVCLNDKLVAEGFAVRHNYD